MMAFISAIGIGAIITHSPILMEVIKTVDALFLLYLGAKMVILANKVKLISSVSQITSSNKPLFSFYKDGVILALSNPKSIIFFTSIYPQFISYGAYQSVQFFILGANFAILSFFLLSSYVIISRHTFGRLMTQRRIVAFNFISGLLLIAIAAVLILSKL
ncbi:MAG: LysE family translocator [Gammaproteobacteria bacterium]|nr:LysE family translocator [Gammaproteobacteria bacterium]